MPRPPLYAFDMTLAMHDLPGLVMGTMFMEHVGSKPYAQLFLYKNSITSNKEQPKRLRIGVPFGDDRFKWAARFSPDRRSIYLVSGRSSAFPAEPHYLVTLERDVLRMAKDGDVITPVNVVELPASGVGPQGFAIDPTGHVWIVSAVAGYTFSRLSMVSLTAPGTSVGVFDINIGIKDGFGSPAPSDIVFDANGDLFLTGADSQDSNGIYWFAASQLLASTGTIGSGTDIFAYKVIGGRGSGGINRNGYIGIALDPDGGKVWASCLDTVNQVNDKIVAYGFEQFGYNEGVGVVPSSAIDPVPLVTLRSAVYGAIDCPCAIRFDSKKRLTWANRTLNTKGTVGPKLYDFGRFEKEATQTSGSYVPEVLIGGDGRLSPGGVYDLDEDEHKPAVTHEVKLWIGHQQELVEPFESKVPGVLQGSSLNVVSVQVEPEMPAGAVRSFDVYHRRPEAPAYDLAGRLWTATTLFDGSNRPPYLMRLEARARHSSGVIRHDRVITLPTSVKVLTGEVYLRWIQRVRFVASGAWLASPDGLLLFYSNAMLDDGNSKVPVTIAPSQSSLNGGSLPMNDFVILPDGDLLACFYGTGGAGSGMFRIDAANLAATGDDVAPLAFFGGSSVGHFNARGISSVELAPNGLRVWCACYDTNELVAWNVADLVGTPGNPAPAVVITSSTFNGINQLGFRPSTGDLWFANLDDKKIGYIAAADLATSGAKTARGVHVAVKSPNSLTFVPGA